MLCGRPRSNFKCEVKHWKRITMNTNLARAFTTTRGQSNDHPRRSNRQSTKPGRKTMKLTPWLPGNTQPLPDRPGLYQRRVCDSSSRNRGVAWARWDGARWRCFHYTKTRALNTNGVSPFQNFYPWRGVDRNNPDPFHRKAQS